MKAAGAGEGPDRAERLRRLIAECRRVLAEGVESGVAHAYLKKIMAAEEELAQIERRGGKGSR